MKPNIDRELQHLIPFTYSSVADIRGGSPFNVRPSVLSVASMQAAIDLYDESAEPIISIAGENVWKISGSSTPELMRQIGLRQGIPRENILIVENNAANTAIQVRALKKWLKKENPSLEPLALAHDFHIARIQRYVKEMNVLMSVASIERVLEETGSLVVFPELGYLDEFEEREASLRQPLLKLLDWHGVASSLVARVGSPQVHDVQKTSTGYKPLVSTVNKQLT